MYKGSTILLCVTIFVIHKQCLIRDHCSIVTVTIVLRRVQLQTVWNLSCWCEKLLFQHFFSILLSFLRRPLMYSNVAPLRVFTKKIKKKKIKKKSNFFLKFQISKKIFEGLPAKRFGRSRKMQTQYITANVDHLMMANWRVITSHVDRLSSNLYRGSLKYISISKD
jgi:hypothetical protein